MELVERLENAAGVGSTKRGVGFILSTAVKLVISVLFTRLEVSLAIIVTLYSPK